MSRCVSRECAFEDVMRSPQLRKNRMMRTITYSRNNRPYLPGSLPSRRGRGEFVISHQTTIPTTTTRTRRAAHPRRILVKREPSSQGLFEQQPKLNCSRPVGYIMRQ
jgi:hypothetical protein